MLVWFWLFFVVVVVVLKKKKPKWFNTATKNCFFFTKHVLFCSVPFIQADEIGEIKREDCIIITRRKRKEKRDDCGRTAFVKWHGVKEGSGQADWEL